MATRDLPSSGTIKLSEVKAEFGKGNNLLDYLGEGGVTSSAPLKLTDFYGRSAGPRPPELIGGTGFYWRGPSDHQASHTFNASVSSGDTVVVAYSAGNAAYSFFDVTVNGFEAITCREDDSNKTGNQKAGIAYVILPEASATVNVVMTNVAGMRQPGFHVFAVKGSFIPSGGTNTIGHYSGYAGGRPWVSNGYTPENEEVGDGYTFVVTKNSSNKNWTSQWWDYSYRWADGGNWDYTHSQVDRSENDSEGSFRIIPEGSLVRYTTMSGNYNSTNAFCAQHFRPASSRLTPTQIMEQQFRRQKAREALRKEAEE